MKLCMIGHFSYHYTITKVILVSWMPDMALYVTTFFTTWQCGKGEWHYTIGTFPMLQIGFSLHPLTRPSLIDNDVACYVCTTHHTWIHQNAYFYSSWPPYLFYMLMASLSKEVKSCVTNHDLDFTRWDTQVPLTRVVP